MKNRKTNALIPALLYRTLVFQKQIYHQDKSHLNLKTKSVFVLCHSSILQQDILSTSVSWFLTDSGWEEEREEVWRKTQNLTPSMHELLFDWQSVYFVHNSSTNIPFFLMPVFLFICVYFDNLYFVYFVCFVHNGSTDISFFLMPFVQIWKIKIFSHN